VQDVADMSPSGDAFKSCGDCTVSDTFEFTCICPQRTGLPKRETTINLEASLDPASGEAGTGVFSFVEGRLDCHVR
jgi:hypothetical protein